MLALLVAMLMTPNINPSVLSIPVVIETPKEIAIRIAKEHHLTKYQTKRMFDVVNCESEWVATSTGALGERGLVQIYPEKHPEITEEQMLDPEFSLDFLASNLFKHQSWWSCWALTE